jgi:hypothetical protein
MSISICFHLVCVGSEVATPHVKNHAIDPNGIGNNFIWAKCEMITAVHTEGAAIHWVMP